MYVIWSIFRKEIEKVCTCKIFISLLPSLPPLPPQLISHPPLLLPLSFSPPSPLIPLSLPPSLPPFASFLPLVLPPSSTPSLPLFLLPPVSLPPSFSPYLKPSSQCSARCCVALRYVAVTFGCVAMRCRCSFTMLASRCVKCVGSYNYSSLMMWCLRVENPVCQLAS